MINLLYYVFWEDYDGTTHLSINGTVLYWPFTVLFSDCYQFKWVNDTIGHDIEDDLLKQLIKRVQFVLRPEDSICFFGKRAENGRCYYRLNGI